MTETLAPHRTDTDTQRSTITRALLEIQALKNELARRPPARSQVVVASAACRLPQAASPEEFWDLLQAGGSTAGPVPADRWDDAAVHAPPPGRRGTSYADRASFVDGVFAFDAAPFGISPREAASMDPHHRLVLTCAWEALERAGVAPTSLRGSRTGVFVGMNGNDYERRRLVTGGAAEIDGLAAMSTSVNFAANRLSYVLGLQGPSLVVDTACSSSLVALDQARRALQDGDCDLAVVAGVNVMLSAEAMVALSQSRMLSPTGRCHTFSDQADGYARGEGCVVVVLRRAEDVPAHAPAPLGTLLSTVVNQDGPTSGITVPNGKAQADLIRRAYQAAGISAADVDYAEAHGTGTALGDPIELRALAAVHEGQRRRRPLLVGATKPVTGHLEGAAGLVGLLKCLLVVGHGSVPAQPVDGALTPGVDWSGLPLTVPQAAVEIGSERPTAGVSSFGYGGTNAHAVVRRWTEDTGPDAALALDPDRTADGSGPVSVRLSGTSPEALAGIAARWAAHLETHGGQMAGPLSNAALTAQPDLAERASVVAPGPAELLDGLRALAAGQAHETHVGGPGAPVPDAGRVLDVDAFPEPRAGDLHTLAGVVPVVRRVAESLTAAVPPEAAPLWAAPADREGSGPGDVVADAVARAYFWTVLGATLRWLGAEPREVRAHGDRAVAGATLAGLVDLDQAAAVLRAADAGGELPATSRPRVRWVTDVADPRDPGTWTAPRASAAAGAVPAAENGHAAPVGTWFLRTLHAAWCGGAEITWDAVVRPGRAGVVPTYPWQATDLRPPVAAAASTGTGLNLRVLRTGETSAEAYAEIGARSVPVLHEHTVLGRTVVPGVVFLELVLRLAEAVVGRDAQVVSLDLVRPCLLPDGDTRTLRLTWDGSGVTHTVSVASESATGTWQQHLTAVLAVGGAQEVAADPRFGPADGRPARSLDRATFYRELWPEAFHIGPSLTLVDRVDQDAEGRLRAVLTPPPAGCAGLVSGVRPELLVLDASVQVAGALRADRADGVVTLGTGFRRMVLRPGAGLDGGAVVHAVATSKDAADLLVTSPGGEPLALVTGVTNLPVSASGLDAAAGAGARAADADLDRGDGPEGLVPRALAAVLGIASEEVDRTARLEDLMDSILLVELAETLAPHSPVPLAVPDLLDAETVAGLIDLLTSAGQEEPPAPEVSPAGPPLRRRELTVEAMTELAAAGDVEHVDVVPRASLPTGVLLTGATGFVGSFLLRELLHSTDRRIYCLVRAEDAAEADRRLRAAAEDHGLPTESFVDRVSVVVGDLTQDRFGLEPAAYEGLHAKVGEIFHNAGAVRWTSSYDQLAPHNVDGTAHVLRFATHGPARVVHFTSTVGVFSSDRVDLGTVDETLPLTASGALMVGYAQTKWVSEMMIRRAGERGLRFTIHRINTGPSSVPGGFNRLDHLSLIIKGCVESGLAPLEGPFPVQAAPIDHVARAYVRLALDPLFEGGTSHLVNEPVVPWSEFFEHVGSYGYALERLPFEEWRRAVTGRESGTIALLGLAPFLTRTIDDVRLADFAAPATRAALGAAGPWCPAVDRELVHAFLDGFVSGHFFDAPAQSSHEPAAGS